MEGGLQAGMAACIGRAGQGCNMTDWTEAIGMLAGVLTTMTIMPQVVQTWSSGSARDFSLRMLLVLVTGVGLWLAYGLLSGSMPMILANTVTLLLASCILSVQLRRG